MRHVPKIEVQEVVRQVAKIETQVVQKIVEVPEVQIVEVTVKVPQSPNREASSLLVGDNVEVMENFTSNSSPPVKLKQGLVGFVREVDQDGDALIKFHGI